MKRAYQNVWAVAYAIRRRNSIWQWMWLSSSNNCTSGYIFPQSGANNVVLDPPSQFSGVPELCIGLNFRGKSDLWDGKVFFFSEVFKRRSRRTFDKRSLLHAWLVKSGFSRHTYWVYIPDLIFIPYISALDMLDTLSAMSLWENINSVLQLEGNFSRKHSMNTFVGSHSKAWSQELFFKLNCRATHCFH